MKIHGGILGALVVTFIVYIVFFSLNTITIGDTHISRDETTVRVSYDQVTNNDISELKELKNLESLEIITCFLDDEDVKVIGELSQLQKLSLSDNQNYDVDPKQLAAVRAKKTYALHLGDYERVWGEIRTNNDLGHYLLKYSYTQNWERELLENYIGLSIEDFRKRIPRSYEVTYFDHFTLPYTAWQIKKDFGIELKTPTHIKIILKSL